MLWVAASRFATPPKTGMSVAKQAQEVGWRPSSRDNGTIVRVFCFQGGVGYFMPPPILRGLFLKAGWHARRNRTGRLNWMRARRDREG
jgi:hypothetical protein